MKIIFSRKGFDSGMGGVASPIFPSGALHSIPIPESSPSRQSKRYREIHAGEHNLGAIVQDLTGGKIGPERFAHIDPDLDAQSTERPEHWRPVFGQAGWRLQGNADNVFSTGSGLFAAISEQVLDREAIDRSQREIQQKYQYRK